MTVPQVLRRLDELRRRHAASRSSRASGGRGRRVPPDHSPDRPSLAQVRALARALGRCHARALALWDTGRRDARLLATLVEEPPLVEDAQLDRWLLTAGDPLVADKVCLEVAVATPWARSKVGDWAHHPQPLVRRAAYVLLAALARTDHEMTDADFIPWVDAVPSSLPREDEGVRRAMLRALSAIASRNETLRLRVLGASARLRPAAPASEGRPLSTSALSLAWRRAG